MVNGEIDTLPADDLIGHSTNLVGLPTRILADVGFNARPRPIHISGVREMNGGLFEMLDLASDLGEAGEAFVKSQASEGWRASAIRYDDGGFSGGTMERPGLRRLLADIDAGLIDVVVVYKIDRLTRSLADFARIVERFDAKDVSFVSVTQAFTTFGRPWPPNSGSQASADQPFSTNC